MERDLYVLSRYRGLGGYSKLTNGLRAADNSAFDADVWAYCSHVKMFCKRTRLLSSHPRLFIHLSYYQKSRLTTITKITVHEE